MKKKLRVKNKQEYIYVLAWGAQDTSRNVST